MDQATAGARGETDQVLAMRKREGGDLTPDPAIIDPAEHNVVFTSLVTADDDIVGLVAYSIYKQNKYDWLQAYSRLEGRMPEPSEVHSYLLGESTGRRLATYRQLAQAVLDGRGAEVAGSGAARLATRAGPVEAGRPEPGRPAGAPARRIGLAQGRSTFQLSARAIVGLCIALVVLIALFLLMRSGAPLPPSTPAR